MSRKIKLKGRLHDRAKMARIRQKLERFQQFLQRNSELLSVPCRVHKRLWTHCGTDKSSLFLCKKCWNRSTFCRVRAIFTLSCKRSLSLSPSDFHLVGWVRTLDDSTLFGCIGQPSEIWQVVQQDNQPPEPEEPREPEEPQEPREPEEPENREN